MSHRSQGQKIAWLMFMYKLSDNATSLRAKGWCRVKTLSGVYLQDGVVVLSASSSTVRSLRALRREIADLDGTAHLTRYLEIIDCCTDFKMKIAHELSHHRLTFATPKESEEDLTKLASQRSNVQVRSAFEAHQATKAVEAVERCEEVALRAFAKQVYVDKGSL